MERSPNTFSAAIRRNPLVPAAILLLAGVAAGIEFEPAAGVVLGGALLALILWIVAECALTGFRRHAVAPAALALGAAFAGMALGALNQHYVEPTHIARFTLPDQPVPITARLRVITAPDPGSVHGNLYWIASATSILTDQGWIPSAGDIRIKARAGFQSPELHRGDLVEAYGWLSRPEAALNPGAMDLRRNLAADRIFAELRIPRDNGVIPLARGDRSAGADPLTRVRLFLRAKLLQHTTLSDVESGDAMVALLLGYRDPAIRDISQAFADAGIAHLLAISGTHILFFTAMVWGLLRFLPMRPRPRDMLIAVIVLAYVLATPCGPPVVRVAIALLMFLLGRLLARPPTHMNMLAAAAVVIVALRPADLFDVGFQLSFLCTAALIVLATPPYAILFSGWIERQHIAADLAATPWSRLKVRAAQLFASNLAANMIGAGVAIPLVAHHFGRFNPYAMVSGLIALPIVGATMAISALQLLFEVTIPALAAHFAAISTGCAAIMIWTVRQLAALPGAAVSLRAPPVWLITLMYVPLLLWVMRRQLRLRRATLVNLGLAVLAVTVAWYTFTMPLGELRVQALDVGQGTAILVHAPAGETWLINAGSRDTTGLVGKAITPALRVAGKNRLAGLVLTSMNTPAAQSAAAAIDAFHPPTVITSPADWEHRGESFSGASAESAIRRTGARQVSLEAGGFINLGDDARLSILWPAAEPAPESAAPARDSLILLLEYRGRRILLLDPAAAAPLELLQINHVDTRADAVILLAPQRGPDAALENILKRTGASTVIWNGRTPWSPIAAEGAAHPKPPVAWNTADGAMTVRIDARGTLAVVREK